MQSFVGLLHVERSFRLDLKIPVTFASLVGEEHDKLERAIDLGDLCQRCIDVGIAIVYDTELVDPAIHGFVSIIRVAQVFECKDQLLGTPLGAYISSPSRGIFRITSSFGVVDL